MIMNPCSLKKGGVMLNSKKKMIAERICNSPDYIGGNIMTLESGNWYCGRIRKIDIISHQLTFYLEWLAKKETAGWTLIKDKSSYKISVSVSHFQPSELDTHLEFNIPTILFRLYKKDNVNVNELNVIGLKEKYN